MWIRKEEDLLEKLGSGDALCESGSSEGAVSSTQEKRSFQQEAVSQTQTPEGVEGGEDVLHINKMEVLEKLRERGGTELLEVFEQEWNRREKMILEIVRETIQCCTTQPAKKEGSMETPLQMDGDTRSKPDTSDVAQSCVKVYDWLREKHCGNSAAVSGYETSSATLHDIRESKASRSLSQMFMCEAGSGDASGSSEGAVSSTQEERSFQQEAVSQTQTPERVEGGEDVLLENKMQQVFEKWIKEGGTLWKEVFEREWNRRELEIMEMVRKEIQSCTLLPARREGSMEYPPEMGGDTRSEPDTDDVAQACVKVYDWLREKHCGNSAAVSGYETSSAVSNTEISEITGRERPETDTQW
ncbi:hypothetical protein JZ751_006357 [Albula glossodonta]|uniref:Uncharacterized protein n=1 Tax=Albula glossodonta TaxID=121402 RepID=A0A8T2NEH8_9TELE|nr:hypothetical protein JZ751_006357 [Albula glossodonta]